MNLFINKLDVLETNILTNPFNDMDTIKKSAVSLALKENILIFAIIRSPSLSTMLKLGGFLFL